MEERRIIKKEFIVINKWADDENRDINGAINPIHSPGRFINSIEQKQKVKKIVSVISVVRGESAFIRLFLSIFCCIMAFW